METKNKIDDKIKEIHRKYSNTPVSKYNDYQTNIELLHSSISSTDEKNVAIIGSYGSGKSSVVKSYLDKYKKHKQSIKISLASFNKNLKEVENSNSEYVNTNEEETRDAQENTNHSLIDNKELEKSILQQFVYEKPYNKLKSTNIRRIKEPTKRFLNITAIITCLLFISILSLILNHHSYIWEFQDWIKITATCVATLCFCALIFVMVYNLKLSRLALKTGDNNISLEAEISSLAHANKDFSVLNAFADEIIYSLHKSGYHIVIIEDLDRIGSLDIFIKLRELNGLINNNEYFKSNKVTFIYCLDDMFFNDPEERSKFFDRIISVEPYLNYTNSRSRINDLLINCGYFEKTETESFANSLAPFIKSQRILNNIFYDFEIHKINESLNPDLINENKVDNRQLLSLLTFKNLYPIEFAKLYASEGILYELFTKIKNKLINNKSLELDSLIQEKTDKLTKSLQEPYNCLEELRSFIYGVAAQANSFSYSNSSVKIYNLSDLNKENCDGNFEFLRSSQYFKMRDINAYILRNGLGSTISERIDSILLKNEDKNNQLKREIEQLKKDKLALRTLTLNEYINKYSIEEVVTLLPIKNDFLLLCLAKNYINENYLFQIFVKAKNNTINDMEFIKNVNLKKSSGFDYKIENATSVIRSLSEDDFQYHYILNNEIVKTLIIDYSELTSEDLHNKSKLLKSLLNDNTEVTTNFLYDFIKSDELNVKLLEKTAYSNPNLYKRLLESEISTDAKQQIITILLKSTMQNLKVLNEDDSMTQYIDLIDNQGFIDFKNKQIVTNLIELNVKFKHIQPALSAETIRNIADNKLFLPTSTNISTIIQKGFIWKNKEKFEENKIFSDLTIIKGHEDLKNYILIDNIEFIIDELCKKKVTNIILPKDRILSYLEDENYSVDFKKKIINNCDFKLTQNIIIDKELKSLLIKKNKFENSIIISYEIYKETNDYLKPISEIVYKQLDSYLNNNIRFIDEDLEKTKDFRFDLFNALLAISNKEQLFHSKAVTKLLKICQIEMISYEDIVDKENLHFENYKAILKNKKFILDQSLVNFISLDKSKTSDFINIYKDELCENYLSLDLSDIAQEIIFTPVIDMEFKKLLLSTYGENISIENDKEYSEAYKLLNVVEDKLLLLKICFKSVSLNIDLKIKLFDEFENYISDQDLLNLLEMIDEKYKNLRKTEFNILISQSQITDKIIKRLKGLNLINKQSGKLNKYNQITLKKG